MELYYTTGRSLSSEFIHFEIVEAYDNQIPTTEWLTNHPNDEVLFNRIVEALTQPFPSLAMSVNFYTRFVPMQGRISDIKRCVRNFNVNLIKNDKLATCLYLPTTLHIQNPPLDVYYGIDDVDDDDPEMAYQTMFFSFKKYADIKQDSYSTPEYSQIMEVFYAIGCCESQECVIEMTLPFSTIETVLKQYGYNLLPYNNPDTN